MSRVDNFSGATFSSSILLLNLSRMSSISSLLSVSGMIPSSPGAFPSRIWLFAFCTSSKVNSVSGIFKLLKRGSTGSGVGEVLGVPSNLLKCSNHLCFLSSGDLPLSLPTAEAFLPVILLTVFQALAVLLLLLLLSRWSYRIRLEDRDSM